MHIAVHRIAPAPPGFYSDRARQDRHAAHLLTRFADRLSALRGELQAASDELGYGSSRVIDAADEGLLEVHRLLAEHVAELRGEDL
jgi:hypothetical protein